MEAEAHEFPWRLMTWEPELLDTGKVKKNIEDMATHSWGNHACPTGVMSVSVCRERIRQMTQAGIGNLSFLIITWDLAHCRSHQYVIAFTNNSLSLLLDVQRVETSADASSLEDTDNAAMQSPAQMSLSCHQASGWSLHPTRASTMQKPQTMKVQLCFSASAACTIQKWEFSGYSLKLQSQLCTPCNG